MRNRMNTDAQSRLIVTIDRIEQALETTISGTALLAKLVKEGAAKFHVIRGVNHLEIAGVEASNDGSSRQLLKQWQAKARARLHAAAAA